MVRALETGRPGRLSRPLQTRASRTLGEGLSRTDPLDRRRQVDPARRTTRWLRGDIHDGAYEDRHDQKITNVLQHILALIQKDIDATSKRELLAQVEDYRRGLVPLVVPLTLLRHYARILNMHDLIDQVFLNPHPKELALRYQL